MTHSAFGGARASRSRRCGKLSMLAGRALCASGEGLSLTAASWLFVLGLAALAAQAPERGWTLAPAVILFAALTVASLFDALFLILPAPMLTVAGACGLILLARFDAFDASAHAAAGVGAFAVLRLVAWAYERWRGSAGLGGGDAWLFGSAGLIVGPEGLASCLLTAVASALIALAVERGQEERFGRRLSEHILPFGPHLALGLWLVFVFGSLDALWSG